MKLRIKGNSVRFRLARTEVKTLARDGYLEEQTFFPGTCLTYAVKSTNGEMSAAYVPGSITVSVPEKFLRAWPENDVTGIEGFVETANGSLKLLIEKDFVCLDETTEDQSDNYPNPNTNC